MTRSQTRKRGHRFVELADNGRSARQIPISAPRLCTVNTAQTHIVFGNASRELMISH